MLRGLLLLFKVFCCCLLVFVNLKCFLVFKVWENFAKNHLCSKKWNLKKMRTIRHKLSLNFQPSIKQKKNIKKKTHFLRLRYAKKHIFLGLGTPHFVVLDYKKQANVIELTYSLGITIVINAYASALISASLNMRCRSTENFLKNGPDKIWLLLGVKYWVHYFTIHIF